MRRHPSTRLAVIVATMAAIAPSTAHAQFSVPGLGGLGGAASGAGGAVPGLGSASAGNITGLLSYCVKNKLVSQAGAGGDVLAKLEGKPDVAKSADYKAGLAGTVLGGKPAAAGGSNPADMLGGLTGGSGKPLSLDSLPASVRTKACDTVLSHAKSLL
jgi:hypothetical protein